MTRRQERRGTAAQWTTANPVLAAGELGVELSPDPAAPHRVKIGDGTTPWATLPYQDSARIVTGTAPPTSATPGVLYLQIVEE